MITGSTPPDANGETISTDRAIQNQAERSSNPPGSEGKVWKDGLENAVQVQKQSLPEGIWEKPVLEKKTSYRWGMERRGAQINLSRGSHLK